MLAQRAAEAPERPWLFIPQGLDWRWWSWGEAAARVEALRAALAARLAAAGVEPPAAVAYACPGADTFQSEAATSASAAIVTDLALHAAGYLPRPVGAMRSGERNWESAAAETGAVAAVVAAAGSDGSARGDGGGRVAPGAGNGVELGWSVRLLRPARSPQPPPADSVPLPARGPRPLSPLPAFADLFAAVETLVRRADEVLANGTRPPRREVAVTTGALDRVSERFLLAWSLATGGALVLEQPAARVATAAWARPTLFVGSRDEVERLAVEAAAWQSTWRGGFTAGLGRGLRRLLRRPAVSSWPFGRLRTVVVEEGDASGEAAGSAAPRPGSAATWEAPGEGFWRRHGVVRWRLADLLP